MPTTIKLWWACPPPVVRAAHMGKAMVVQSRLLRIAGMSGRPGSCNPFPARHFFTLFQMQKRDTQPFGHVSLFCDTSLFTPEQTEVPVRLHEENACKSAHRSYPGSFQDSRYTKL